MEKNRSIVKAAAAWLPGVGSAIKQKLPALAAGCRRAASGCVVYCKRSPKMAISIGAALLLLLIIGGHVLRKVRSEAGDEGLTYVVKRGPLSISVVSTGTIENKEKVIVRNKIEGARATILSLVEEGKNVKKGETLVTFDSSDFEDQLLDVQIQVGNSSSDVVRASETLAITQNQAEADNEKAELELKFAKLALKKYSEGEYPQALQKAKTDITIAEEELRRSEERLAWSEKLSKEEFITRSEYEADELALRKQKIELQMAQKRLEVLEKYTHVVDLEKLESDVKQAELAMDRAARRTKADILKAEVDLSAKKVGLGREQNRLEKITERIDSCRLVAPVDGLVVYATSVGSGHWRRRSEPLAEGQAVDGREELIYLPTTGAMTVKFDVQEGSLTKIEKGIAAVITVDALPGKRFTGVVTKVSVLPDTGQSWLNPDLKVYNCEVDITSSTEGLRPGMSCTVEALYQQLDNVLFVPIQSVVRVDGKPTVYVKGFGGAKKRNVETGLDNNRMIHIVSGLEEGDEVLLSPPLRPAEKKSETVEEAVAAPTPAVQKPAAGTQAGQEGRKPTAAAPTGQGGKAGAEGRRPRGGGGGQGRSGAGRPRQ